MEYEASVFVSQVALSDEDFLELDERVYDIQQIAAALKSDIYSYLITLNIFHFLFVN